MTAFKAIMKYLFIGTVAGVILYIGIEGRYTRDLMVYSQGVVKGVNDCKKQTTKTSRPTGDTERVVHWPTVECIVCPTPTSPTTM